MRSLLLALTLLSGCTVDPDGDGLNAREEKAAGTDPQVADSDGDGFADGDEVDAGTDPLDADSDDDGLDDGVEVDQGTDPLDADSDDDGLDDGEEAELGTDPLSVDSDGDRIGDADELERGTDPLDADSDDDGLDDGDDADAGADPLDPDFDDDGLLDGEEEGLGCDLLDPDTDDDGYLDGDEVAEGTDPADPLSRIYEGRWPYRADKDALAEPTEGTALAVGVRLPRLLLPDQYGQDVDLYDLGGDGTPVVLVLADEGADSATLADQIRGASAAPASAPGVPDAVADGSLSWAHVLLTTGGTPPSAEDVLAWHAAHPDQHVPVLGDVGGALGAVSTPDSRPWLVLCDADLTVLELGPAEDVLPAVQAAL